MKKILITGAKGFIGSELVKSLCKEYEIIGISREDVDLTNLNSVTNFFGDKYFDIVIHCATVGGRRFHINTVDIFYDNIMMLENLMFVKHRFGYFINLSSGAEFDKNSIILDRGEKVYLSMPKDYYGLSKYIISQRLNNEVGVFNLRIFSCFGLNEKFGYITTIIKNCLNHDVVNIPENKFFDFFYIKDLITLIKFIVENYCDKSIIYFNDLNAVYNKKYTLLDIYFYIKSLCKEGVIDKLVLGKDYGNDYTGSSRLIDGLGLNFIGLENGINEIYTAIKN